MNGAEHRTRKQQKQTYKKHTGRRLLAALIGGFIVLGGCTMDPEIQETEAHTTEISTEALTGETAGTTDTSGTAGTEGTSDTEETADTTAETTEAAPMARFVPADELDQREDPVFYRNPSRINGIGDPFIIRDQETGIYTMIATSASIGYYGWNSEDLVNWSSRRFVYERPEDSWSTDSYWAPEVIHYQDKYYMFYTARHERGSLLISVAVADSAEGPYVDVSDEPVFDFGFAIIDGSVFIDDDGTPYFYYTKDVSENVEAGQHVSASYGVQLSEDLLSIVGEPVELVRPDQRWENPHGEWVWNEGPIVIKHDDLYYLAYSANFFESPAYSVGYAVSEDPLGPYTKAEENPVLHAGQLPGISGSGHHSYVYSPDDSELFTAYHTHTVPSNPTGNRQMALDRVLFTEDGKMVVNGPTTAWLPAPSNDKTRLLTPEDYASVTVNGEPEEALRRHPGHSSAGPCTRCRHADRGWRGRDPAGIERGPEDPGPDSGGRERA